MPECSPPLVLRAVSLLYGRAVRYRNSIFDERRVSVHRAECVVISVGNLSAGGTGKTPFVQLTAQTIAALCPDIPTTAHVEYSQKLGQQHNVQQSRINSQQLEPQQLEPQQLEPQQLEPQQLEPQQQQRAHICVVSRGYRRTSRGEIIVSDGKQLCSTLGNVDSGSAAEYVGDEALLHAERLLPLGVGVVVNKDKYAAARCAVQRLGARVVIVDDGFQHRRLYRNLDIVLVDRQTLDCPIMLPAGRLREPLHSLRRADIVVCMNGVSTEELSPEWLKSSACLVEAQTQVGKLYYVEHDDNADSNCNVERRECGAEVQQQSAFAFCGIAKPQRFLSAVAQAGIHVDAHKAFADHHRYTLHDVKSVITCARQRGISLLVTTEKDAVKLRQPAMITAFSEAGCVLSVLPVECVLTKGQEQWEQVIQAAVCGVQP